MIIHMNEHCRKNNNLKVTMVSCRTVLAYLYPKTRKKSMISFGVVLTLMGILFSLQRTVHRKMKNETLARSRFQIYNNILEDEMDTDNADTLGEKLRELDSNDVLNHFPKDKVFYDPGRAAKVEYFTFNSTKPPDILISALIFTDSDRSRTKDKLKFLFKSLKVNFDFVTWNRMDNYLTMPRLIDKYGSYRYNMFIFTNEIIYDELDVYTREILQIYCKKFNIGIIILTRPPDPNYGKLSIASNLITLPLTLLYGVDNIEDVEIPRSSALRMVKSGNTLSGELPGKHHVLFKTDHPTFEPVAITNVLHRGTHSRTQTDDSMEVRVKQDSSLTLYSVQKSAIILCDKGEFDGVKKIVFGVTFWDSWLYQLILVDAFLYASNSDLGYFGLDRHIQIDVDDVFVGKQGRRLVKEDVKALVAAQKYFANKIPGFQFNLGFSSRHFKRSNDTLEIEGDEYIMESHVTKHFRWFDHTAGHIKPHQYNAEQLTRDFEKNKRFAVEHGIPVDYTYSVAPHHSGVYPVHPPLYTTWKEVFGVQVTSTEGYPHLYPAHGRKGFIYDDVMVLPRQTCGLFTKTLSAASHPKGPSYLYHLTQGGDLFWTIIFNQVNVFMTHALNYGMKERLAISLFKNVTGFVEKWTNIKLKSGTPVELARKYFELYPKQMEPLWTDPCTDLRHQKIWSGTEKYCDVGNISRISRLPDILIVGPQKTGSTALLTFLGIHPDIVRSERSNRSFEEVQFFNKNNYKKGLLWYMNFFLDTLFDKKDQLYVDKSANYFDSLKAPQRAYNILPNVKIIVISSDPKLRAYSWYQHMRSKKDPIALSHSFYEVITGRNKTADERFWMLHTKCLLPGRYAEALERWLQYYDVSQVHVVDGEDLKEKPVVVLRKVQAFLDLSPYPFGKYIRYNQQKKFFCLYMDGKSRCLGKGKGRHYEKMQFREAQFLSEYYHIPNLRFNDLLKKIHKPQPRWLQKAVRDFVSRK